MESKKYHSPGGRPILSCQGSPPKKHRSLDMEPPEHFLQPTRNREKRNRANWAQSVSQVEEKPWRHRGETAAPSRRRRNRGEPVSRKIWPPDKPLFQASQPSLNPTRPFLPLPMLPVHFRNKLSYPQPCIQTSWRPAFIRLGSADPA